MTHWSKKEIVRQLRQRKGQPMHHAAMKRKFPALVVAACRHFGSYRNALEAAGINYEYPNSIATHS